MKKYRKLHFIIEMILVAVGTYLFFSYIIILGNVPSSSMSPTIMSGDIVVSNGLAYIKSEPKRGDIILFDRYVSNQKESIVKIL